ncbi:MAG TPA: hypothetical protein PK411_10900 [Mesotoga infera]|nr:hypothetical protein [Mesotoga sp.]NLI06851.1 hypothetical protein [Thermotogaceae bacterium]HNR79474.1 hypothetical protein [Mesotoga infera]HNS66030.1 hypothetical protein [Mesotoga infera]HON26867.1 hypothetical protein [Mesotoga infera]
MENQRLLYVLILVQAALLGLVLFFGDSIFPILEKSSWSREIRLRETADRLVCEYFDQLTGRNMPDERRITGYVIEKLEILDQDDLEFAFSVEFSVKPFNRESYWNKKDLATTDAWVSGKLFFVVDLSDPDKPEVISVVSSL